jgi:hypothetical protein
MVRRVLTKRDWASLFLLLAACEQSAPVRAPAKPLPSTSAENGDRLTEFGVFPSKRFGVDLPLPTELEPWKIDDSRGPWLSASQGTHSTVLLRMWRSENRMNRDKCEAQAREMRALPNREDSELLEVFAAEAPPGFDTQAEVRLATSTDGRLFGFTLAFGGLGRRCFAYVFVTSDKSVAKDRVVGDRLAIMLERSFRKLRFERDTEFVPSREPGVD